MTDYHQDLLYAHERIARAVESIAESLEKLANPTIEITASTLPYIACTEPNPDGAYALKGDHLCVRANMHDGVHRDSVGRIWSQVPGTCGLPVYSAPEFAEITCTLPPRHEGKHRHGASPVLP